MLRMASVHWKSDDRNFLAFDDMMTAEFCSVVDVIKLFLVDVYRRFCDALEALLLSSSDAFVTFITMSDALETFLATSDALETFLRRTTL